MVRAIINLFRNILISNNFVSDQRLPSHLLSQSLFLPTLPPYGKMKTKSRLLHAQIVDWCRFRAIRRFVILYLCIFIACETRICAVFCCFVLDFSVFCCMWIVYRLLLVDWIWLRQKCHIQLTNRHTITDN